MDTNEPKTVQLEVQDTIQEQRLNSIIHYLDSISRFQEIQAKRLTSINIILIILIVLIIIGVLF